MLIDSSRGKRCDGVAQLAQARIAPHVSAMTSEDIYSRTTRRYRPKPQDGPIIDQDGRIVESSTTAQNPFESGTFEFRTSSANPFGELTREQRIARLEALAKLLDVAFILPGTNIRYGIDGIIGLVPVIGDIITTAISLWLVREARAIGAPWHVTARMLGNVAIDGVVGLVPVAGDAFDVMFRANIRNMRLLRRWLERQR